jgi:uncharacterized protein (TIGR02466 family)
MEIAEANHADKAFQFQALPRTHSNTNPLPGLGLNTKSAESPRLTSVIFRSRMSGMIHTLFPSQVYQAKLTPKPHEKLRAALEKECFIYAQQDDKGQKWALKNYPGGYTSYSTLPALHQLSPTFMELKKYLDGHLDLYVKNLEMDISAKQLKMNSMWLNIMPPGVVHTGHIHPLSTISGTYYVRTPKNCSSLKFEDPRLVAFMASPPRKPKARAENQRFISLTPNAGELILFESWMRHEVPPNQAKTERVSISFNYEWI